MPQPPDGVIGGQPGVGMGRDGSRLDACRQGQERALRHDHVVGEASVHRQAGELVVDAEHVDAAPAGHAHAAAVRREDEHGVALGDGRDTCADLVHPACVLVAEDARERDAGGLHQPLDRVQVGRADARAADPDHDVVRVRGLGLRPLDELERLVVFAHECRFHGSPIVECGSSALTSSRR